MTFIGDDEYAGRRAVEAAFPEAAVIRRVRYGWAVFETYADYESWRAQR